MALSGHIVVEPAVLESQAAKVDQDIRNMKEHFENLQNYVKSTEQFWQGEAGDAHRNMYQQKISRIEEMFRRYEEHVIDLREMAGIYQQTEQAVEKIADALPASIL